MNIKLDSINSGVVEEIIINENILFGDDYKTDEIIRIEKAHFDGKIFRNSADELKITGTLEGTMILEDSISLDQIPYDFSTNIEEILEKDENTIDILPILWQNTVLEVPLRYTKVEDYSSYSGDGWKLISEEEGSINKNNPFLELREKFKEEW